MAFVTKNVFNQLTTKIVLSKDIESIDKDFFINKIYPNGDLFSLFNQFELKRLYIYRYLLENNTGLEYYHFNPEREDTYNYVFSRGGHLKYHLFYDCESFSRGFIDITIPDEIKDSGINLINTFRGWVKTMKFREGIEKDSILDEDIVKHYNSKFARTHKLPLLNEKYKLIQKVPPSGIEPLNYSFNLNVFENKISEISELKHYLSFGKTKYLLGKLDYLYAKSNFEIKNTLIDVASKFPDYIERDFLDNYGLSRLKEFWFYHRELKLRADSLLKEYFRYTYEFKNINFENITLEKFGLKCCYFCNKKLTNTL